MEMGELSVLQHTGSLLLFLEQLHSNSTFSDLKIVCEDGEVDSYRVLLGACSELVKNCLPFESEPETTCLILPGVKVVEMEAFHKSIYNFKVTPSQAQLNSVLKVLCTIGVNMNPFLEVKNESSKNHTLFQNYLPPKSKQLQEMVTNGLEMAMNQASVDKQMKVVLMEKHSTDNESSSNCEQNQSVNKEIRVSSYDKHLENHRAENEADEDRKSEEEDEETTTFTFDVNEKDEIVSKSGPKYSCEGCFSEFDQETDLIKHKKNGCNKQHFCESCNKMFSSLQTLTNHMKLHTKELEFKCNICGKCYVSRSVLGNHMKTHDSTYKLPRFKCNHCEKIFTHPSNLKRHVRTAHFELSDKKTYVCQECGKTFRDPSARKHHLKTHMAVRPFPCSMCPKSFGSKSQIDNHIRIHTGEKPFVCNACGRCFVTKGQLKSHKMNRHVGIQHNKSHLCQECGQSFVKEFDLRVHMRKHTGERPFVCMECGKTFRSERNLVNHCRIHTGDKPYKCETCEKCFASCAGLRQHFKCHATCRLQATEGAYCKQDRKPNRYGRVRLESIPELSMDEASSLQTLENFSVPELKASLSNNQSVEETVVYFNTENGLALVESGIGMESVTIQSGLDSVAVEGDLNEGMEGVTIQAIGLEMNVGEEGQVLSLVQIGDSIS